MPKKNRLYMQRTASTPQGDTHPIISISGDGVHIPLTAEAAADLLNETARRINELEGRIRRLEAENERLRELRHETPAYRKANELQQAAIDLTLSWFNDHDLPYRQSVMVLNSIEAFIGGAIVAHQSGLQAALVDIPAGIMAAYTELDSRRREAGYGPVGEQGQARVHDLYEGAQRALTGQDKGEALASLLIAKGAAKVQELLQHMPKLNRGRPQKSISRVNRLIGQLAEKRRRNEDFAGESYGATARALIEELRIHAGTRTDKGAAFNALENSVRPANIVRNALNAVSARGKQLTVKEKRLRKMHG